MDINVIEKVDKDIRDLIYIIRGQQVMLDFDLAQLYGYEAKQLNRQVKRNIERFPEDFMFQLTEKEMKELSRCQIGTPIQMKGIKGGRTSAINVFTEQGIYMLSSVLRGEIAVKQNIAIIRTFKEMRHYLIQNQSLLNSADLLKLSNTVIEHHNEIQYIKDNMATHTDIDHIMDNFILEEKVKEFVFLNGQKFEADEVYISIYKQAKELIYIIDDYISIDTLSLLKYKNEDVDVIIFTDNKANKKECLKELEVHDFNIEYPTLQLRENGISHDRYIIIDYHKDNELIYHCGASSKDAGKKVCTIHTLSDAKLIYPVIDTLLEDKSIAEKL